MFSHVSQAVSGLDLPKQDMKEVETKKLPEAINNMFLIARRIQARFAQIPKRPVSIFIIPGLGACSSQSYHGWHKLLPFSI